MLPAKCPSRAPTHAYTHTMPSPCYQSLAAPRGERTNRSGTGAGISLAVRPDSLSGSQTPLSGCPGHNKPRNPQDNTGGPGGARAPPGRILPAGRAVSRRSAGPRATGTLQPGSRRCCRSAAAVRIPRASITSPPPPPPRALLSAAPPRRPPARLGAPAARRGGQQRRRRRRPHELAQLHQLKQPRRQPEHPSPAALPRRRLWPRRLTTPGSQSLPRPAQRGETNQSGRPKVFLRLCSAGLFPGAAALLLG